MNENLIVIKKEKKGGDWVNKRFTNDIPEQINPMTGKAIQKGDIEFALMTTQEWKDTSFFFAEEYELHGTLSQSMVKENDESVTEQIKQIKLKGAQEKTQEQTFITERVIEKIVEVPAKKHIEIKKDVNEEIIDTTVEEEKTKVKPKGKPGRKKQL